MIRRPFFLPLLLLIAVIFIWKYFYPPHLDDVFFSSQHTFKVMVVEEPEVNPERLYYIVKILEADGQKLQSGNNGLVKLTLLKEAEVLIYRKGDQFSFSAILKRPNSFNDPGVFDYGTYLERQGIAATCFLRSLPETVSQSGSQNLRGRLALFKERLMTQLMSIDANAAPVLAAIVWGDESRLTEEAEELFRAHGLSHLLVVSGMHFAAIAWLLFEIFSLLLSFFPALFLRMPRQKWAYLLALIGITLFYALCPDSPSVFRGYMATTCFIVACLLNRQSDPLNILFAAAFLILLLQPSDLFSVSFQFSFMAVFSLITLVPLFRFKSSEEKPPLWKNIGFKAWDLVCVQIAITLGLTPLQLYYFPQWSVTGVWMNFIAVPLVELVIVPLGVLAVTLSAVFSWGLHLFRWDLFLLRHFIDFLEVMKNGLNPLHWVYPPHVEELVVYYMLFLFFFVYGIARELKVLAMVLVLLCGYLGFVYWQLDHPLKNSLTQIDVGQGDSQLIETTSGKRVLIDGGGNAYLDIGEKVLVPYLLYRRIPKLDIVVVTHPDLDHYGGLITLIKRYDVGEIWLNGQKPSDPLWYELNEVIRQKGLPVRNVKPGDVMSLGERQFVKVMGPVDSSDNEVMNDNNRSLVLKWVNSRFSALLTGDLEALGESRLIQAWGSQLRADVLKVGHHGSKTSTSKEFLDMVQPKTALVGVGKNNRFHHPNDLVIERLEKRGVRVRRTDLEGEIKIEK